MKMETRSRAIDKIYKRRDRIEMPDFQREEVWSDDRKRLLIDSILRGWHLPKFYFRKTDDGGFDCVDGQQRLSAIFSFFEGSLTLADDTARLTNATVYSDFTDDASDAFDDFEIEIEEIEGASDRDLEELFKRLQLGTPLNTAERLNAISGNLRDFCHEMAEQPFFAQRIGIKNTRYTHFETVVKWVFVEARGIHPKMRLLQLEALLEENRTFSRSSELAMRIKGAVEFLGRAFPADCRVVRNRANALSVCMLASRVHTQRLSASTVHFRDFVETFFAQLSAEVQRGSRALDKELLRYQQAITSGSTGGDSVRARIGIITKRLATHAPVFAALLSSSYSEVQDVVSRAVGELQRTAEELVYELNRIYSGTHGEELFKMTTKTSRAIHAIGDPCIDVGSYGSFIDNLYFIVYEGSGSCNRLPDPVPDFAMNVKFLRSDIRHDLDHGPRPAVAKKLIRGANVFEKYSGKKTPEECGSDEFTSTQLRILDTLIRFLTALK